MHILWITGQTLQREIEDMGADSICIKDMAGLLLPYKATELDQSTEGERPSFRSSCIPTIPPALHP